MNFRRRFHPEQDFTGAFEDADIANCRGAFEWIYVFRAGKQLYPYIFDDNLQLLEADVSRIPHSADQN